MIAQLPLAHVPVVVLHATPEATHAPATQQPPPVHVLSGQHGWFVPPHVVLAVPSSQMSAVPVDSPDATQSVATQHPPPLQGVAPAQQPSPGWPHAVHLPPVHSSPPEHADPAPMHVSVAGLQQAPVAVQVEFAQQACPVPPQVTHVPAALHASPAPVHVLPAQHGLPSATPQVRQCPPLHARPSPHVLSAQQAWLLAPHATQLLPLQTVLPDVHVLPLQQGSPSAPQVPHAPAAHVPLSGAGQVPPEAVQVAWPPPVPGTQHPPPVHAPPAQQT